MRYHNWARDRNTFRRTMPGVRFKNYMRMGFDEGAGEIWVGWELAG